METLKNAEGEKLAHLTGFRAVAAYLVLIEHSLCNTFKYYNLSFTNQFVQHVSCLAYLGMSIFFVLSGFVITYTYYDRFVQPPLQNAQNVSSHLYKWWQETRGFAVARFARLYPLYILFLLCAPYERHPFLLSTFGQQISFFTLTQTWWNMEMLTFAPAWSISTECFFYLCFALWMIPGRAQCSTASIKCMTIATMVGVFLILAATSANRAGITTFLSPMLGYDGLPDVWGWFQFFSPYVRIGEFIAGACAARMFMMTRHDECLPAHQRWASILCIGSGLAIITLMIGNTCCFSSDSFLYFLSMNFGYAPFLAYIFYACSRYPNLLTKWCGTPLMQAGGEISYSLYILQLLIYSYVIPDKVAAEPSILAYEVSLLKAILYILLTTIIAYCSYHIIEVPSRRYLRKWLS